MRKPMMAGNWKMNKTIDEAVALARAINSAAHSYDSVDRVVCPAAVCLPAVADVLAKSPVAVGAQNMHWEDSGAYTGEISPAMLKGLAEYVIIGHSERREYFAESDATVNKKLKAALAAGIVPILCVGESLAQNQAGETHSFVGGQVKAALDGLTGEQVESLVIAYEPIWAIGTGRTATPDIAQDACAHVRSVAGGYVDGASLRVLYGGSVSPANAAELLAQPDIDGALVGGASLDPESFAAIVDAA